MLRDDAPTSRVKAALARIPRVEDTFGGTALMVRAKMCVSVEKDRIIHAALEREACRTVVMKGRQEEPMGRRVRCMTTAR